MHPRLQCCCFTTIGIIPEFSIFRWFSDDWKFTRTMLIIFIEELSSFWTSSHTGGKIKSTIVLKSWFVMVILVFIPVRSWFRLFADLLRSGVERVRGRKRMVLQLKMKINKTEISCRSECAHTTHEASKHFLSRSNRLFVPVSWSRFSNVTQFSCWILCNKHNTRRALESKHYRTPVNVEHSTIMKTNKHFRMSNGHRLGCGKSSSFPLDFSTFETLLMVLINICSQLLERRFHFRIVGSKASNRINFKRRYSTFVHVRAIGKSIWCLTSDRSRCLTFCVCLQFLLHSGPFKH